MASDEPTETPVPADDAEDGPPEGVFGNLPRERPGLRSPRRGEQAGPPAARSAGSARAGSGTQAESRREPVAGEVPDPTGTDHAGGGVEDVAWAGVAAAAEAATIGVRLATRALEAMRDAVDRR